MDRDQRRTTPHTGPESSSSFPEGNMEQFSLPLSSRPVNPLVTLETNSQGTFYIPPSGEIGHQPSIDHRGFITMTQKEALSISAPKVPTCPLASTPYRHEHSTTSSGSSSYYWFSEHKSTFEESTTNVTVCGSSGVHERHYSEPRYFNCNPQLAESIQKNFELDQADLDELLNYPEEQTTAENLPYLLKEIRMKKAIRAGSAVQSFSSSTSRPTACTSGEDAGVNFGPKGKLQDKMSSTLQPILMTKYEQPAACSPDVDARIGRNISWGNTLVTDGFQSSNWPKEVQNGSLVGPPPRVDQTQTQSNQTCQSGTTQSTGFRQTGISQNLGSVPPLPLQHKDVDAASTVESKTQGQGSSTADLMKNQLKKTNIWELLQVLQALQPEVSSAAKSKIQNVSDTILPSVVISNDPVASVSQSKPMMSTKNTVHVPSSEQHSQAESESCKDLPSLSMMHDYAAVMPRTFSHTCSLCKEECAQKKDWITHEKSTLHKENCKHLRSQYPHWDGVVPSLQSDPSTSAKTLYSTSLHHHQTNKCDSHTRSRSRSSSCFSSGDAGRKSRSPSRGYSPSHRSSSKSGRDRSKSSSRSHSQCHSSKDGKHKSNSSVHSYTPRRSRSSRSWTRSSNSSRSYSPKNHTSRYRRDRANGSSHQRRPQHSNSGSRSRSCSPCYIRCVPSRSRSRSTSYEKQSSPKRTSKKLISPRRKNERRLSRGRSPARRLSPRMDKKWMRFSPGDSGEKSRGSSRRYSPSHRSSLKSRRDRSSSSSRSHSQRHSSTDGKNKSNSSVHLYTPRRSRSRRSWTGSSCSSRSRSYSPKNHTSRYRRDRSNGSSLQRRLQHSNSRSRSRSCSPRYNRSAPSCYLPRSRSYEKQSSANRNGKKPISPRRQSKRRLSRGRSPARRLSPRSDQKHNSKRLLRPQDNGKQWSLKRSLERRSSPTKTDKRLSPLRCPIWQSFRRNIDDKRCSPTSGWEREVSSGTHDRRRSPKRSRDQQPSPRKNDDKRWSPTRRLLRQVSPTRTNDRRWSPTNGWERRVSLIRTDDRQWSPERSCVQQSSPRKNDKRWSQTRKREQSPPKNADVKQWSPTKPHERQSPPRYDKQWSHPRRTVDRRWSLEGSSEYHQRTDDKTRLLTRSLVRPWTDKEQSLTIERHRQHSFPRRDEEQVLPKNGNEEISSMRQNRKRHASPEEEVSSQKKKSCSIQMLTKQLLENSALQSVSRHSNIEDVVNVMVPVLLAELAKNPEISSPQLVLPSQAIKRMVSKPSSSGLKSLSSSNKGEKMQRKLKIKQESTSKKAKDGASKRVLSIKGKHLKKTKLKAGVGDDLAPCDNLDLLPIKKLLSLHQKLVRKAKLLSSSKKHISSSKARPLKTRTLESVVLKVEHLKPLGSERSLDTRPQFGLSKPRTGPVVSRKNQNIGAKVTEKTRVKKATRITVAESNKGKKIVSKVKTAAPKKSTNKALDKTAKWSGVAKAIKVEDCLGDKGPTQNGSLPELAIGRIIKTEDTSVKALPKVKKRKVSNPVSKMSKSPGENPNSGGTTENPKPRESEVPVKVEGSTLAGEMLEATAAEQGIGKEMVTEVEVNGSKTSADEQQNKNAKCSPDGEVVELLETTNSPPSMLVIASTLPQTETQPSVKPPESLVNQPKLVPNPNTSCKQPLDQPQSSDRPLDAVQKTGHEEKKNNQKDSTPSEMQKLVAAVSTTVSSDADTAAAPNATDASLTVGERIASYLDPKNFNCVPAEEILSSKPLAPDPTLLLITNLPACEAGCSYTEEEVVNLLSKFEFQYAHDNIYVIPQGGWAFVLMPNQHSVTSLTQASVQGHLTFKQHKLNLHVVTKDMSMTPLGFYSSLMKQTPLTRTDDVGSNIIYIQDVSQRDAATLRKALKKIGCVKNVLSLLNKLFVEFETDQDADRLGVWHSLVREDFVYTVTRLKVPRSVERSQQPQQPQRALPDRKEILSAAGAPDAEYGVPQGTTAPCWVTTKTPPYVFPTACPWFNVPKFLTVQTEEHILATPQSGSEFSTVMLTGLPEATYKHEDVARLVWPYFPKQDLQTLYYNIVVLPLQRRAFVFFCDWESCCSFVLDCVKKPVSVMNCTLGVHLVLEDMLPGSSEETMYRALMKWSNGYLPELFMLEKRLLCVEMLEANVELIGNVLKEVAAISSFVTFLPLTNRIWIEMFSRSSATKVLQEMSPRRNSSTYVWSKVGRIECANDLHRRLKETGQIMINLGTNTQGVGAEPPSMKTEAHVPLSEARDDAEDASSPAPAAVTESTITKSESKAGDEVAESAKKVQDPKVETLSTTEESQPCRITSAVADNSVSCVTDQEKKTQKDPAPNSVSSVSATPIEALPSAKVQATTDEVVKKKPAVSASCLTHGEKMRALLYTSQIRCYGHSVIMSPEFVSLESRLILIFNLPQYQDGSYTEDDISNLLQKFGFQHDDKNIYVIPQNCMAFALMPSYQKAREVFLAAKQNLTFNGSRLFVGIVKNKGDMTPFKFYKFLMETVNFEVTDDGTSVVYIQNISPSEARDLRETLNKIESVKNYLPLLNKVFIEFESALDADRIGVWYSLLKRRPPHHIWRANLPRTADTALPPRMAAKALPDAKDIVAGPVVPIKNLGVPQGSKAPFFISLTNEPFLFPTLAPWFIVPRFSTVLTEEDLVESASVASKFSTVMLTGLPGGNYKHEDVAQLVWKYFPKQTLQTLFYNIVVLPLQKRAFVYFNNWQSCYKFAKDCLKNQVSLKGQVLNVHLILEEMHPGLNEEHMYQTLMKWSNAHVPELESLQDRLLCVELLETSLPLIIAILTFVTSVSPIVSFLSLANRLCIEMAEPSGVTLVVARHAQKPEDWKNLGRVESVKSLKQRLKDSHKTKIGLKMSTKYINAKTPAVKSEPPPQVGTVNVVVTEVKGESSAESLTPTTTVKTEPSKPSAKPKQSPQTHLKTPETSVKAPPQPKTDMSKYSASTKIGPNGKSPETGGTCAATSSAKASSLTPAENVFEYLKRLTHINKDNLPLKTILSPDIMYLNITLGVSNLPKFGDGRPYTQTNIMNLLKLLGFNCQYHQFFFVPESQKAFLIQANAAEVQKFFTGRKWKKVTFKGSHLYFYVFQTFCPMTSVRFYKYLMSFSDFLTTWKHFDETDVVYLHNISEHKAQELKEAISKNDSVINYLPLHDKVFIHCKTPVDAERVKAWFSFWKHRLSHNIQQTAVSGTFTFNASKRPSLAAPALPLGEKVADGPNVPITTDANPEGNRAPFWITMTRSPYMFHIAAPWFNIPAYQTISPVTRLEPHLKFPTIMLTGLPNPICYTHEDVALLVWKYFPEQTLHTLYNNIVVLPLQRRAFVFFGSSHACLRFLQDQKRNQIKLKDSLTKIHLVLEDINLGFSEVSMFRTLMKWSNIHVPEQDSLEERLLCVEVSGTNDQNVMMVMKEVAMFATFARFLPLANRIYIEMVDSSEASKVMENLSVSRLADQREAWNRVGRVESLVSRKERLKDARKIAVDLERGTMSVYREATAPKGPLSSRKEEEPATLKALPDKSLLPSDKGTEYPQIDLGSLNKLKAIILQHKNERRSVTLNNEISSESGSSSESCSSSKQTTKETKSSHLSSTITDVPTKVLKNSGSPCGSTNTILSPSSDSLSGKKQKDSTADAGKTSPSSSSSKSVEFSTSSNEKSQSNKSETQLCSPRAASTGGNACSSAEVKPTAESCTTETQSDSRKETSVLSPPAQGQNLEFTEQIQTEESFKDATLKQAVESKGKERDNNVKSPAEEVHVSVAEQKDKQHCSQETPGSEKAEIVCQVDLQVSDKVVDRKNKMDVEAVLHAEGNGIKERAVVVNEEKRLHINEGSAVKPDCRPEATEAEEGETLPIKQESLDKRPETRTANSGKTDTAEKVICKDSVPDESVTQRSVRRTSKQDETSQDKVATDEPTITKRSARKTIKITEEDSLDGSGDKNQRGTRRPPARDSQEHNKEDAKPATCEQKPSQEISDDVNFRETEEEEQEAATTRRTTGPTPERKSKRGIRSESPCERMLERCAEKEREEETCRDTVKGRRTRSSSSAAVKSQEKEENPTERAEVNSVAMEGKSAKMAPVVDPPARGEKLNVSKAGTPNSRPDEGLQTSHGVKNEVQRCSQSASVQEENHLIKDEVLAVKPSQRTGASNPENGENSPKDQEVSAQKKETQTKERSAETETEGAKEMISVGDESGTKRSFRQTTRLAQKDETNKDKAAVNEPTVATTSTTSRKRKIREKESLAERKEEETPMRTRRRAADKDSPENKEKTQKAAEETGPKDATPLGCEQNPSPEISEVLSFRRTEEEGQEAATTRRRGRPKTTTEPAPGRRTRSSSAAVKTPVETSQWQKKEENPTESAEVNSVAAATRSRGPPKKTAGPAPVRKSTRVQRSYPDGQTLEK